MLTQPDDTMPLRGFLGTHADSPLDRLRDALRQACLAGGGCWMEPTPGMHRPGTHRYEVTLHGVFGDGLTDIEAARSWRKAAMAVLTEAEGRQCAA